jgi:hypothetical protein
VATPAPVDAAAEQLSRRKTGQTQALAAQVWMVGVTRFGGKIGQLAARSSAARRWGGLRKSEVTLEAHGSLQALRPYAHGGPETAPQLTARDRQLCRQRTDLDVLPRHQSAHGLSYEWVRVISPLLPRTEVTLQPLERCVWFWRVSEQLAKPRRCAAAPHVVGRHGQIDQFPGRHAEQGAAVPGQNRTPTIVAWAGTRYTLADVKGPTSRGTPPIKHCNSTPPVGRLRCR